jgi:hypothetical protein
MASDVVLEDSLSRLGTRVLHVVRMGERPDVDEWIGKLPLTATDSLNWMRWEEKGLGVNHLMLIWNAREVVSLQRSVKDKDAVTGLMWWMETGQRMSEAIREACERHFLDFNEDAQACFVHKVPEQAPKDADGQALPVKVSVLGKEVEVQLVEASWAPKQSIIVMKEMAWLSEMK